MFKAKILINHKANQAIVFTNKSTSYINIADCVEIKSTLYVNITDYVEIHMSEKSSEQITKETPKVHIAISNAKRNFVGIYYKSRLNTLTNLYAN